jgi:hypothetical protein
VGVHNIDITRTPLKLFLAIFFEASCVWHKFIIS